MIEQLKAKEQADSKMAAIREVREKKMLLDKCRRKMEMSALDPVDVKIVEAASEQLEGEINLLCWRIGL